MLPLLGHRCGCDGAVAARRCEHGVVEAADVEAREQDLGEELNRDGFQWG